MIKLLKNVSYYGLPLITYAPGGRGVMSPIYISIAPYMQKGEGGPDSK